MRKRYRYDKESKSLIPVDEWFRKYGEKKTLTHYVVPDIEPYKPVTGDMAGKWIHSRRQHREFLKRNNLVEVGNEYDYMTRHGGMSPDNPNLMSEEKHEEHICQSLVKNLERLRSR